MRRCGCWYHYGCAGIKPNDLRLSSSEIYLCPVCTTLGCVAFPFPSISLLIFALTGRVSNYLLFHFIFLSVRLRPSLTHHALALDIDRMKDNSICSRPDCGRSQSQPGEFVVFGIVGRKLRYDENGNIKFLYLVKWAGCVWSPSVMMTFICLTPNIYQVLCCGSDMGIQKYIARPS